MIHPRTDHVLIAPEQALNLSSIIIMPDKTQALPPARGKVLAIGPLVTEVAVGDTVCFERFDWTKAPEGGIILKEGEILARETKEKTVVPSP